MTDILLVQPPIRDFYLTRKRTFPYGLACIAGALIREGFSVEILDALSVSKSRVIAVPPEMAYLDEFYGRPDQSPFALFHRYRHYGSAFLTVGRRARDSGAFLVGISALFTPYAQEALETAEAVKTAHPGCKVVLGGHHPTACPEAVMSDPAVDFVLRGEGEASMPALARALRTGGPLDDVPGIVYRKPGGGLFVSPPAFSDRLEAPPPHLLESRLYRRGERHAAAVVCTRGCPMDCSYCCVGRSSGIPYRRRSVASVLAEIAVAVENGARFIDLEDENLSLDRKWFTAFLTEVSSQFGHLGIELRAMNGLYPGSLDPALIDQMAQAGFRKLNLALGSSVPEEIRRFNRPDIRSDFDQALVHAARRRLEATGYVIAGAPFQKAENAVADLLFLARRRVLAAVSMYYPAPGSRDYEQLRRRGLLPEKPSLMRSTALPVSNRTSRIEAVTIWRLGRILNFMKSLLDAGEPIPRPARPPASLTLNLPQDRRRIGTVLLSGFLADGRIRGCLPDGTLFEHRTAEPLVARFLQGISRTPIIGTR